MKSPNPDAPTFRLGLDFDGVITNRNAAKSYGAYALFGARIEAGRFTRKYATRGAENLLAQGVPLDAVNQEFNVLTTAQYNELQHDILASGALVEQCPPIPGVFEGLAHIRTAGNEQGIRVTFSCITARATATTLLARELLDRYLLDHHELAGGIPITSIQAKGTNKVAEIAAQNCAAFVDDNLTHMKGLSRYGITAFLLDYPYNHDEAAEPYGVERVANWEALTARIIPLLDDLH